MNGCTITKTGDGSGGDNSSFYGNNSSIYCGAASSSNYQSTTAASGAKIVVNNGTINRNGYTLTYSSLSGSGTINETTVIEEVGSRVSDERDEMYTLDGRRADASAKGIVIQNGKKVVKR